MEKLEMQSMDKVQEHIKTIAEMFPNALTEVKSATGGVIRKLDFDILKQELADYIVDDKQQRYQFTWPDKNKAILNANLPINKTLRPCREESVNFDTTENLYIEGDNLEVLKLLQETYLGKVKMIYIDPPYNIGSDFIYEDYLVQGYNKYMPNSGQYDNEGNRLVKNLESNGRFHTDWLNMIYPRLKLARDLLSKDGVIFISIDDGEQENLKKICDEIFSRRNFIAQIIWERAYAPVNLKKHFSESHDYIICYAKNIDFAICNGLIRNTEANDRYNNPDNDPRGVWTSSDLSVGPAIKDKIYEITTPSGRKVLPPNGYCWRLDKNKFNNYVKDNRIWFGLQGDNVPRIKRFLAEVKQSITPMTIWKYSEVGHSQEAKQNLKKLFDNIAVFDYPKSINLIKRCIQLYTNKNDIILDFFSGSATTAHATIQSNVEDNGNRKFIMVQLPEETAENNEAFKAGYTNICEIGKERIRRAGKKIKEEFGDKAKNLDIGFRVFKVDSSNMKDVYYTADKYTQNDLDSYINNIKEDRSEEDLLFQVLLDMGIMLSSSIKTEIIADKKVFNVEDNFLLACFDKDITDEVITAMANKQPDYAVLRDFGMIDDSVAINFEQIFKTYSPNTIIKVL